MEPLSCFETHSHFEPAYRQAGEKSHPQENEHKSILLFFFASPKKERKNSSLTILFHPLRF
tara:strand:+ start:18768 stop:18950 length:183 start_codon:yes stop_codon:yes gene_type:complete